MYELIGRIVYWIAAGFGLVIIAGGLGWLLYRITLFFWKFWRKSIEEWTSIEAIRRACDATRRFKVSTPHVCPFCLQITPEGASILEAIKAQEGADQP